MVERLHAKQTPQERRTPATGTRGQPARLTGDPAALLAAVPATQATHVVMLLQRTAGNQAAASAIRGRRPPDVAQRQEGDGKKTGVEKHYERLMRQPKHPVAKFFAGLGEGAVNTTVGPWLNPRLWLGYFEKCDNIWNRRGPNGEALSKDDADLLYGNKAWRVLQLAVETTNQIATIATALAVVLGIIGAGLLAAGGAGAALIGIGGLVGGIATVAHGITFLLRAIATARDGYAFRKADKDSPVRAYLRGKLWNDAGGLLGNAIGTVMGGLGGAFQFGGKVEGPTNLIGDAVNASGLPKTQGAKAGESLSEVLLSAAIGQEANTVADEMTGIGGALGDDATSKGEDRALAGAKHEATFLESMRGMRDLAQNESTKLPPEIDLLWDSAKASDEIIGKTLPLVGKTTELSASKGKLEESDSAIEHSQEAIKTSDLSPEQQQQALGAIEKAEATDGSTNHDGTGVTTEPPVGRPGRRAKMKQVLSGLWGKFLGIPKRIKRLWQKAKAKLVALYLKVAGLDTSAYEFSEEMKVAPKEQEAAAGTEAATKAVTDDVAAQIDPVLASQ